MRILHVIHQYFPDHVGGTEHYTRALALAQQLSGHQVAIFCRQSKSGRGLEREVWNDIQIYRAFKGTFSPARRFRSTLGDGFLADSLASVARETRPDLVHIQHLMGLPIGATTDLWASRPLVVTLHDYWWVCANAQLITDYEGDVCDGPVWWLNCARCALARAGAKAAWPLSPFGAPFFGWRSTLLRKLIPHVDAWIAPTEFVGDWYAAHGLPRERMQVIGHGIELPPAGSRREPLDPKSDPAAMHFAYVGGLSHQKGIHVLVDAFNELPASARLTLAGDMTAFPEYCADLRSRATHPGICFTGRLNRPAVWQLLADADLLVVPSLWYETASLVVQEAFAIGTPVIAADHGALAERVRHEIDGLCVPPGDTTALRDAMLRIMNDPGLLDRLRAGIRQVTTLEEHSRQVEAVYQEVLLVRGN